jgi:quercetin dioxygenase-like cupin family protein
VADLSPSDAAIDLVATLRPDAAIVDVSPEDKRGLELAIRLRELDCGPPIVLTSSAARTRFGATLRGFPFVAKADLCTREVVKAIAIQKGHTMNTSTKSVAQAAASKSVAQAAAPLWFLHNLAIIRVRSDQTGGGYAVVETVGAPGDMPPLHVHHHDDEGFYVLDGALRLHVGGDQVIHAGPGQLVLAPRGVPHVYVVESDRPARWLAISNGGFDRFVEEVAVPAGQPELPTAPEIPDPDELLAIAARHGIEILGPPGTLPE